MRHKVRVTDEWIDHWASVREMEPEAFIASLPFDIIELEAWYVTPELVAVDLDEGRLLPSDLDEIVLDVLDAG